MKSLVEQNKNIKKEKKKFFTLFYREDHRQKFLRDTHQSFCYFLNTRPQCQEEDESLPGTQFLGREKTKPKNIF